MLHIGVNPTQDNFITTRANHMFSLILHPCSGTVRSPVIRANKDAECSYLTLDELGSALEVLSGSLPRKHCNA